MYQSIHFLWLFKVKVEVPWPSNYMLRKIWIYVRNISATYLTSIHHFVNLMIEQLVFRFQIKKLILQYDIIFVFLILCFAKFPILFPSQCSVRQGGGRLGYRMYHGWAGRRSGVVPGRLRDWPAVRHTEDHGAATGGTDESFHEESPLPRS